MDEVNLPRPELMNKAEEGRGREPQASSMEGFRCALPKESVLISGDKLFAREERSESRFELRQFLANHGRATAKAQLLLSFYSLRAHVAVHYPTERSDKFI